MMYSDIVKKVHMDDGRIIFCPICNTDNCSTNDYEEWSIDAKTESWCHNKCIKMQEDEMSPLALSS